MLPCGGGRINEGVGATTKRIERVLSRRRPSVSSQKKVNKGKRGKMKGRDRRRPDPLNLGGEVHSSK